MKSMLPENIPHLNISRDQLDTLYERYNRPEYIRPDPLQFVHRYQSAEDREIVALIAALYALGRVELILGFLEWLFEMMGSSPAAWLREQDMKTLLSRLGGRTYRFFSPERSALLLAAAGNLLNAHGTLENAAISELGNTEAGAEDLKSSPYPAISLMAGLGRALNQAASGINISSPGSGNNDPGDGNPLPGIIFPRLTHPWERNGAAKRLMLFLRWMVRNDAIDPGGWTCLSPAQLLYPLDTHMMKISSQLGARTRKTADMSCVLEITRFFALHNPEDPVKYDFVLTRFGIHPDLKSRGSLITLEE